MLTHVLNTILTLSFHLQKNTRPHPTLVKYMIDIAMAMHYISEKGLVHRVSYMQAYIHIYTYTHVAHYEKSFRILLLEIFWLMAMSCAKFQTLACFENYLRTVMCMCLHLTIPCLSVGWLLRVSLLNTSQWRQMFGVMGC